MRAAGLGIAAALLPLGTAVAQSPRAPEPVREAVIRQLAERRADFMEPGDPRLRTPPSPDAMLRPIDVNGDGVDDWRADYEQSEWSGGWCGTGGCLQQVWVSAPGGQWVLAIDTNMHGIELHQADGERRLETWVHGTRCNSYGAENCRYGYAWDARLGRLAERPNRAGQTRLHGAGAQLIAEDAPPEAAEVKRVLTCDGDGGEASAFSTPDLNGDGARDWVVEAGYACPLERRVLAVLLSEGVGGFREGGRPSSSGWAVDIARSPATLLVTEACERQMPCAETAFRLPR